jgi:hypothetical protein
MAAAATRVSGTLKRMERTAEAMYILSLIVAISD